MCGQQGPNNPGRLRVLRAYKRNPDGTLHELSRAAGMSQTAVNYHLHNLEYEGVITRERKRRGRIETENEIAINKIDQRKTSSTKTNSKRADAGRKGLAEWSKKSSKTQKVMKNTQEGVLNLAKSGEAKLQARIDQVVEMACNGNKSAGVDVFRSGGTVRMNGVKVG